MNRIQRAIATVVCAAIVAATVWMSSVPIAADRSSGALLRLAWSARPERVEKCRQRSQDELAQLPSHMRQPLACEGTTAEYRLQVRLAGALVADRLVHGGGLRRDRRLYVLEEIPVPAGDANIEVRFDRVGAASDATTQVTSGPQRPDAVPAHLTLDRRITLRPREVVLVTYSAEQRNLIAVFAVTP